MPWQIIMATYDQKDRDRYEDDAAKFADAGTPGFQSATAAGSGASTRTAFGDGDGVYQAFFTAARITRLALVDGSSMSLVPELHTNYLVYDLVESTEAESLFSLLRRLDSYQAGSPGFQNNDTVWGDPSVRFHTAGPNGYSGLLAASGGTAFRTNTSQVPDKICVMGINRDSDNDIQSLCAYSGNLNSGKSDSWRGDNPAESFWSYWGHDFHSNSQSQRIGSSLQTSPGIATGAMYYDWVYLLAYSEPSLRGPGFTSAAIGTRGRMATAPVGRGRGR